MIPRGSIVLQSSCCCWWCFWCIISISTKRATNNNMKWQSPIHIAKHFLLSIQFFESEVTQLSHSAGALANEVINLIDHFVCATLLRNGLFQERMWILDISDNDTHIYTRTHICYSHTCEYIVFIVQHLII